MHTRHEILKYPKTCDLCEAKLENVTGMKLHMKEYSYRESMFKCEDCYFCGPNYLTMEVHNGKWKYHNENFECGLCDLKAKDREDLETRLTTC
jgi:hypothetical protein